MAKARKAKKAKKAKKMKRYVKRAAKKTKKSTYRKSAKRATKKTAVTHLALAATTLVLFTIAFFLRDYDPTSVAGFSLTAVGVLCLGAAGAFGGHLAYHHRIGVEERSDERPAVRTSPGSPSAWSSGDR